MASNAAELFIQAAWDAGCARDQVVNLLRAGVGLQPRQLAASAAARLCDLPGGPTEIGYGGARGGGKSHWMLVQIAVDDCQRFAGLKCLILRKVGKALKEGFEDLLRRTLGNLEYTYIPSKKQLLFPNGSQIILGHFQKESDVDTYLGLEYDVIGIEEATTLSASKVKAIRTCNRTSKPGWRPRMYFTTNPGGVGHVWFKSRFVEPHRRGQERETRFVPATVFDNKCVNADYQANLATLTGWQKKAWLYGDWDIAAGQFFTTFRRDVHALPSIAILPHWTVWCSLDYGFTHYTMAYLLAKDGDGNRYLVDEHAAQRWLVERHVQAIEAMLQRNGVAKHRLATFVAGGDVFAKKYNGGTIADEYKDRGIVLKAANDDRVNGAGEVLKLLGDVDAGIKPRLYISERCSRLLECLPALEHDPGRPEDVLKWDTDDEGLGGDDPYDGARYGLMAAYQITSGGAAAGGQRTQTRGYQPR